MGRASGLRNGRAGDASDTDGKLVNAAHVKSLQAVIDQMLSTAGRLAP